MFLQGQRVTEKLLIKVEKYASHYKPSVQVMPISVIADSFTWLFFSSYEKEYWVFREVIF